MKPDEVVAALAPDRPSSEALAEAARAVLTAADEARLAGWDSADKEACYRKLLLAPSASGSPPIFAHEAASHITAGNADAARRLAEDVAPALQSLMGESTHPDFKNLVLFLLVARAYLPDAIRQEEISRLHLEWFDRFVWSDYALPYSVMFHGDVFGRNRDDLLNAYWPDGGEVWRNEALRPPQILLLEWLTGRHAFSSPDNSDLAAFLERSPPGDNDDLAAAGTLFVRHYRKGGVLTSARLAELGIGATEALAADAASARAQLPTASALRGRTALIEKKPYQALQAARGIAASKFPFPKAGRRLRVAVCISGQLRGYETAFASWRRRLLTEVDATFFVHSWNNIGRSDANPSRYVLPFAGAQFPEAYRKAALAAGYEEMRARYPVFFSRLAGGAMVDAEDVKNFYGAAEVVLEDDKAGRFLDFSNQQKMHYKIWAADCMAREAGEFDLFLRIRPDLEIAFTAFSWRDIVEACRTNPMLFAEKPAGVHYGGLMIGDQFALAAPEEMSVYAGAWETFPSMAGAGLAGVPTEFTGHVSLALTCWLRGVAVTRAPVKFGKLVDARPMALAEIAAALEENAYNDAIHQNLMAALQQDRAA